LQRADDLGQHFPRVQTRSNARTELHAQLLPDKIGACDLERKMTFQLWYSRACRVANTFAGIGLIKGDRVCVLAYNCVEWLEIYAAAALPGIVVVPNVLG
jgi:fatty-acyl-CoA synthase